MQGVKSKRRQTTSKKGVSSNTSRITWCKGSETVSRQNLACMYMKSWRERVNAKWIVCDAPDERRQRLDTVKESVTTKQQSERRQEAKRRLFHAQHHSAKHAHETMRGATGTTTHSSSLWEWDAGSESTQSITKDNVREARGDETPAAKAERGLSICDKVFVRALIWRSTSAQFNLNVRVCMIEAPQVREAALVDFRGGDCTNLTEKGFQSKQLKNTSLVTFAHLLTATDYLHENKNTSWVGQVVAFWKNRQERFWWIKRNVALAEDFGGHSH